MLSAAQSKKIISQLSIKYSTDVRLRVLQWCYKSPGCPCPLKNTSTLCSLRNLRDGHVKPLEIKVSSSQEARVYAYKNSQASEKSQIWGGSKKSLWGT